MKEAYSRHKRLVDWVLFFALIAGSVYVFFVFLFGYLGPFFVGLLISLALDPLANFFVARLRLKRWLASLFSLLIFIAGVSSLGVWLVVAFVRQLISFMETAPQQLGEMLRATNELFYRLSERYLPDGWDIPDIQGMATAAMGAMVDGGMAGQALGFAGNLPAFLINVLLALVSAYFFLADRERIFRAARMGCPSWVAAQWAVTRTGLRRAVAGYFRAQVFLMLLTGTLGAIGLYILGNPFAMLLGLLFAALDFIPMMGPAIVILPWALVRFIGGDVWHSIGLLIILAVVTVVRQTLQPKILGSQIGVHPLALLVSFYVGFGIFGVVGFIVGPSLLMIFKAIKEANRDVFDGKNEGEGSPDFH